MEQLHDDENILFRHQYIAKHTKQKRSHKHAIIFVLKFSVLLFLIIFVMMKSFKSEKENNLSQKYIKNNEQIAEQVKVDPPSLPKIIESLEEKTKTRIYIDSKSYKKNDMYRSDQQKIESFNLSVIAKKENLRYRYFNVEFEKKENYQKIGKALYDQDTLQKRKSFYQKRITSIQKLKMQYPYIQMAKYNMKIDNQFDQQLQEYFKLDYERIESKYNLSSIQNELPLCIIVTGYQNNKDFRVELNLNSILSQNYSNYHVVVVDAASTDGTSQLMKAYAKFYKIPSDKVTFKFEKVRKPPNENTFEAVWNECRIDQIGIIVDGDDEILGRNAFKIFNANYQKLNSGVLYSDFFWFNQNNMQKVRPGNTKQWPQEVKKSNSYRKHTGVWWHMRTFRISHFRQIDISDLLDTDGEFFKFGGDNSLFYPMFELSCAHVNRIDEYLYLYNVETGNNEDRWGQYLTAKKIMLYKKKYTCGIEFKNQND